MPNILPLSVQNFRWHIFWLQVILIGINSVYWQSWVIHVSSFHDASRLPSFVVDTGFAKVTKYIPPWGAHSLIYPVKWPHILPNQLQLERLQIIVRLHPSPDRFSAPFCLALCIRGWLLCYLPGGPSRNTCSPCVFSPGGRRFPCC